jgi:hypothetical protein
MATTSNRPSGISRASSGASNRFRITPMSIPALPALRSPDGPAWPRRL